MLYNQSYNLLAEARDNPDMNLLATSHNVSKETMRRHLESLNEGIPSSLYVRLDNERVELSETGKVYANACEKINRLVIDAELKAEKFKREREGSISVASLSRSVDRKLKSLAHETRFKVRFFDPSGVNASSSLKVCGRDFDAAMTFYDDSFLKRNRLKSFELYNDNIAVAFSKNSENAGKKRAVFDFLKFLYSEKELAAFTEFLGMNIPINYEYDETKLGDYYYKEFKEFRNGKSDVVTVASSNPIHYKNLSSFLLGFGGALNYYNYNGQVMMEGYLEAYRNGRTAKDIFNGSTLSEATWQTLREKASK